MDLQRFKDSLNENQPPSGLTVYAKALWYDAKGKWDEAHKLVQDEPDEDAAWIHAYLHRKEGDLTNAGYWYQRAGKKRPGISLTEEWEQIAAALLTN